MSNRSPNKTPLVIDTNSLGNSLKEIGYGDSSTLLVAVDFNIFIQHIPAMDLIEVLLKERDTRSTLVMNAYTWAFCRGEAYHHEFTPCEIGLIPEMFRRMPEVVRSHHPIYSFSAYGAGKESYLDHKSPSCWGTPSPFSRLMEDNALCVLIGNEFPLSITLLHKFEEDKQVPYRYMKRFSGKVDFGEGSKDYATEFFVRKIQTQKYYWTPAVNLLKERKQVLQSRQIPGITAVKACDLQAACYELLDEDPNIFLLEKP